jgi:hypothetical protein
MQLVPYQNSSEVNDTHQNNVLTVATNNADIINTHCYYDSITLMLKWTHRSHPGYILDAQHMHRKLF